MFQASSNLKVLREVLCDHLELPDHFLGVHAFFDGDTIFARDVVQVNYELIPFPVDFERVWDWFKEQLRGPPEQETFVYELGFGIEHEEDPVRDRLVEITRGSGMTVWMMDFAHQTPTDGRRFVVVTIPDKKRVREFRETLHGRHIGAET
ncbi:hypothetical protein [Rhizobium sp. RAF56]|jgi:hypothetical protein|uniref:hypothetical protein n=1 Tax=Rhizobium sp. RAF56 TaxID=3233062 RepID=UPI003F9536EF